MCAKNSSLFNMKYDVIYAGAVDGTIRALDIETGKCLFTIYAHTDAVLSIAEYEDVIYSCSEDKSMKAFNRLTTTCIHTFEDENPFLCLTVNNNGLLISSVGTDEKPYLQIWNCKTKQKLFHVVVPGMTKPVNKMHWNGNVLYTSNGTIVRSWEFVNFAQKLKSKYPLRIEFNQKGKISFQEIQNSEENHSWDLEDTTTFVHSTYHQSKLQHAPITILQETKVENVEQESQFKLTQEIFNKLEGMEDQMMVMSKNIQDLYLILKNLESNYDKQKTK